MSEIKPAYKTKTRIFKNAGYLVLTRRRADGTESKDPKDIYTSDTAIVQSISTKYSLSTEEMDDGNSFFSAASHVMKVDAVTEIVFNTLDPKLWAFETGAETVTVTNGYYRDTADQYIIPDDGVVKINASALKPDSLVLARRTNGEDFIMGEDFKVDYEKAILTFSDAKTVAGTVIFITSYKQSITVTTSSISAIPKQGSYKMEIIGENCDKDETDAVADNYVVSNVKVSGDISQPIRQKAYNSFTSTFSIEKPAPSQ